MHAILVSLALVFALPSLAQTSAPRGRPMHEMQGDCANFGTDLTREFALWGQPPLSIDVRPQETEGSAPLPAKRRIALRLVPNDAIRFAVPPGENRGAPDRFGGTVQLAPLSAGLWRVSASNGAWLDITTDRSLLDAPSFEMQTKCDRIFKSVTYRVTDGHRLFLQVNGSRTETIGLLLTLVR